MKVSSKNVVGALAAAFLAGGLLSACPSKGGGDGGSSSGASSSGASCNAAGASCTVAADCCTGLACNGGTCSAPCVGAGSTCSASICCIAPLVCDPTSNTCLTATPDGGMDAGCPLSPALGGCITAANCAAPNVCLPASDGGGYCGPVTTLPTAICLANGATCTATSTCCGGSCVNGTCTARGACGVNGQGCNVASDCCNYFKCVQGAGADQNDAGVDDAGSEDGGTAPDSGTAGTDGGTAGTDGGTAGTDGGTSGTDGGTTGTDGGTTTPDSGVADAGGPSYTGTCQPSCGGILDACDTSNNNADCCTDEGYSCIPLSANGTAGVCYPAQYTNETTNQPIYCGGPCSSFPCALGLSCQVPTAGPDANVDPCAAAGLSCSQYGVCANPPEGAACIPGGPPCQPYANSTVTDLQCVTLPSNFGGQYACLQPCSPSDPDKGTSDCVDPLMVCTSLGAGLGSACVFNEGCTTYFGACNSSAVGDGYCEPYNFSNGFGGLCFQATLDGGTPGSACDGVTRQNGGFCDPTSYCLAGVCEPMCNSGTKGVPACAQNDGGVTVGCVDLTGQGVSNKSPAATAFGICSVDCDFTSPTGGGCPTVDGNPEKCFPPAEFGLPDAPTGVCVAAAPVSDRIAVGQPCTAYADYADDCVDGALCQFDDTSAAFTCVQLCTDSNTPGQPPCKADQTCNALFGIEAHEGYCGLSDGGLGG